MKKLISLVMAITMIFSVFTVNVGAAEIDTTNREQLLSLACQVFPEYAAKIAADQAPTSDGIKSVSENIEIIFTETRKANDDFYITYTEHSNGVVTLANFDTEEKIIYNQGTVSGNSTYYDVTLYGTTLGSANDFTASHVKFVVNNPGYDQITSTGTTNIAYHHTNEVDVTLNEWESASYAASIAYRFTLTVGSLPFRGLFEFTLRNNEPFVLYTID